MRAANSIRLGVGLASAMSLCAVIGCDSDVASKSTGSGASSSGESGSSSGASSSSGGGGQGGASSASSSSSSSSGGGQGVGGAGGDASGCSELAPITLSPGSIMDVGNDGKWSPGEGAIVNVVMTNTSAMDIQYPGFDIVSDNPKVTTGNTYNAIFVLAASQMYEAGVDYTADASVPPGTVVTFTVTMHSIMNVVCVDLPTLSFTATIQ